MICTSRIFENVYVCDTILVRSQSMASVDHQSFVLAEIPPSMKYTFGNQQPTSKECFLNKIAVIHEQVTEYSLSTGKESG